MLAPEDIRVQKPVRVLRATGVAGGVVEVREAEVVAELVGEDAQAAVLRLDGVVADPDAGRVVRDRVGRVRALAEGAGVGADVDTGQSTGAAGLEVAVPAVAPDGVGAVGRVTGRLVAARVDDLEVVDEAVGLVELAVTVDVVAVLVVEGPQVVLDLRHGLARLQLLVHPDGQRVAHQRLGRGAGGHRGSHRVAAVAAAVEGLVVGHLHPLGDVTVDRVAAGGLALVVRRHPVEVHVLVVGPVVVRLPQGGVVRASGRAAGIWLCTGPSKVVGSGSERL